jgi:two-component system sensor histidine kinase AlgZ
MARSINQNAYSGALPNFRNLGMLRILLLERGGRSRIVKTTRWESGESSWSLRAGEPLLVFSCSRWSPASCAPPLLASRRCSLELALTARCSAGRPARCSGAAGALLLLVRSPPSRCSYFHLRGRALSPALAEARLQALQARIRPHFLFNSINAVLSLIRQDPRRAELALEDMAELFRVLMADNRELSPLAREVELCRQYLGIEQLRLGGRLRVEWQLDAMPQDALVPPLVLQPLLENAVYHGIEPRLEPGTIVINIAAVRDELHAVLRNPFRPDGDRHEGNRMAVANIRERLALHFDAEANLSTRADADSYEVRIVMPYVKGGDARSAVREPAHG